MKIAICCDDRYVAEKIERILKKEFEAEFVICDKADTQIPSDPAAQCAILIDKDEIGGDEDNPAAKAQIDFGAEKLQDMFSLRQGSIEAVLDEIQGLVFASFSDRSRAEKELREIYKRTAYEVFEKNEWLELYLSCDEFAEGNSAYMRSRLIGLYKDYTALLPAVSNDSIEQVLLYILNNPESDLKQKTVASKMYVNSTYLSTVFSAQVNERFVDYLSDIKLRRAAYLLVYTDMKINEIAVRLGYKDIGYFSRLFKKKYALLPSQYRMADNYTFVI